MTSTSMESPRKKPYAQPRLVAYGSVTKLTQGKAGSAGDGGAAGMTMNCL